MRRISCSSSTSETASISFLGSSSSPRSLLEGSKSLSLTKELELLVGLSSFFLRERFLYPRFLVAKSLLSEASELDLSSLSTPSRSSDCITSSLDSVSITAAIGFSDFFGRPRGFFSTFSSLEFIFLLL